MSPVALAAPSFADLRDDLGHRRIGGGLEKLARLRVEIEQISPDHPQSGVFLGILAQWVDAGFDSPELLVDVLNRFPHGTRSDLPVRVFVHLRMTECEIEMAHENYQRAISHLEMVRSFEDELSDPWLILVADFWMSRCLRNLGRYEEALPFALRAEESAITLDYSETAAMIQVTRAWLLFQKGRLEEASTILRRAENALRGSGDHMTLGNIQSARGRIARRQDRLEYAVECFENAIHEYRKGPSRGLQMARALQNLAFAKRSRAQQAQRQLDLVAASRRSGKEVSGELAKTRDSIQQIRSEAADHLDESTAIYERWDKRHGIAGCQIVRGFLKLDDGDFDGALADAETAFQHGQEKNDLFVMARARLLQCVVENTMLEEQIGDPVRSREAALAHARDAAAFAGQTQNRRLLARAYVWQGLTFASGAIPDLESARKCCDQALALLQPEGGGRLPAWKELASLQSALLRATPVDPKLRAWSAGVVDDQTFQQLTEEFARIVIPKVWEREGRKISRVAARLSISPRKVRRILQSVGEIRAS